MRTSRTSATASLYQRIRLETATVDESTGQPIRTWTATLINEPASWNPMAGGETVRGRQVDAGISGFFVVNYRDNVYSTEQRIVFGGKNYGIVHVKPVNGDRRYIELHCKADG